MDIAILIEHRKRLASHLANDRRPHQHILQIGIRERTHSIQQMVSFGSYPRKPASILFPQPSVQHGIA
jgi:hypothetical protein